MSKLEKDEEKKIKKWCKNHSILFIKFTPMGEKGWPDRIAVFPNDGHTVWIELKRNKKKPTPLQYHRMEQILKQGGYAVWFDSAEGCIEYLQRRLASEMDTAPISIARN